MEHSQWSQGGTLTTRHFQKFSIVFSYFGQSDLGMYAHSTKKGLCVIKCEFALDSFIL